MKIITNNRPRQLLEYHELPERIQADFDYVDKEDPGGYRFFCYRGNWYDTFEFQRISGLSPLCVGRWTGYQSDSFFSGVVLRYANDFEEVIVGRYY